MLHIEFILAYTTFNYRIKSMFVSKKLVHSNVIKLISSFDVVLI